MIKRARLLLALVLVSFCLNPFFAGAPLVHAEDPLTKVCDQRDPNVAVPPSCQNIDNTGNPLFGPGGIMTKAINILSLVGGVVSVIVILIGGVKFITSSGDPSGITSARNTILYAIIALVIMASAQVIVRALLSKL